MKCRAECLHYQFSILAYPGAVSHSLSSVFGFWLQRVLSYSKVWLTVLSPWSELGTEVHAETLHLGNMMWLNPDNWFYIRKSASYWASRFSYTAEVAFTNLFCPKWPNVPLILFKRFFRYSAFTSGLLSHNTVASNPIYFNFKCPCLQFSGTAFPLSSIKRCI